MAKTHRHERRDIQLLADFEEPVTDSALDLNAEVHYLQEVLALAEELEGALGELVL
ncbi:hypothetical protein ACFU6I_44905 [Streptomyces sp. NPDC057486]|uniref:hypothetical protein n=1 Tax=Streptomyces sp. NPDC057486 TaxID=3346145 RepID=UPI003693A68A